MGEFKKNAPVALQDIKITDDFWAGEMELVRT